MHPDVEISMKDFKISLEGNFRQPIIRQSMEGVSLSKAILNILNSKMEFHQPGVISPG